MGKKSLQIASILAFSLIMGCDRTVQKPRTAKRSFLMLAASGNTSKDTLVTAIKREVLRSKDPVEALRERLSGIYNQKVRRMIFFQLLEEFPERALQEVVLQDFVKSNPQRLPSHFLLRTLSSKDPLFQDLLEIYLDSGAKESMSRIHQVLVLRNNAFDAREQTLHARVLFHMGRLGEAFTKLESIAQEVPEGQRQKINYFLGKVAYYQGNDREVVKRLQPLFHKNSYREKCVVYLMHGLVALKKFAPAFQYLKILEAEDFEDPLVHTLKAQVLLFAQHPRAAMKSWKIAKGMGAQGELFEEVSFYLSHYSKSVKVKDMGKFSKIKKGDFSSMPNPSYRDLNFYKMRRFTRSYQSMKRKDKDVLKELEPRYIRLSLDLSRW